jgi:hypothetical protein
MCQLIARALIDHLRLRKDDALARIVSEANQLVTLGIARKTNSRSRGAGIVVDHRHSDGAAEDSYEICRMVGVCTPIDRPKQIEGLRSASRRAHPVLAVSGIGCSFCGSSRSRMAFNDWI